MTEESLTSTLDRLVDLLRQEEALVIDLFQPPIAVPESLPVPEGQLRLANEVRELFAWRNGTRDVGGRARTLIPLGWWFPPYGHAWAYFQENVDNFIEAGSMSNWQPTWFPVLRQGMDALVVDCSEKGGGVWLSPISVGEPEHVAPDLRSLVERVIRRFESGEFYIRDGQIELLDEDVDEISLLQTNRG